MCVPIIVLLLSLWLLCFPAWAAEQSHASNGIQAQVLSSSVDTFQTQWQQMVEQLTVRGIQDKGVLKAISEVPRHRFVDPGLSNAAYQDSPLPLAYNQTISQPYIVAYMTEAAKISPNDRVLEIGTGSGYQAAVLGELAEEVYTVEIIPELAESARQTLNRLGYENVHVKTGNGFEGWAKQAPYDAILVTAAPDNIPEALVNQLSMGGRMIIPVGTWYQELMVLTKTEDGLLKEKTLPVRFVPMTGKH
ncbi:MAG: protein-L-isoaspartate(D-aspartate) O-methyltransferase [Chroococcidiopsidaceae cyanobacterium CP_BM_ER_R8_30]|nr:protein-L-isoaspartate(D-aspartate) O-methyltransferase [Chroococcidiopsidaceae cyanobacterium CP_BM_ER_R8_30]